MCCLKATTNVFPLSHYGCQQHFKVIQDILVWNAHNHTSLEERVLHIAAAWSTFLSWFQHFKLDWTLPSFSAFLLQTGSLVCFSQSVKVSVSSGQVCVDCCDMTCDCAAEIWTSLNFTCLCKTWWLCVWQLSWSRWVKISRNPGQHAGRCSHDGVMATSYGASTCYTGVWEMCKTWPWGSLWQDI